MSIARKFSEHIDILTGIAVGEEMSDDRRAKKADRFLQESESAHDDALRNLQGDVRLAEKFDELEKQSDKKRGDPFFYTLRRKRTDASALKTEESADRTTKQGLGPVEPLEPQASSSTSASRDETAIVDASSEPTPPATSSAELTPQRAVRPPTKGRSGLLVVLAVLVLGGLALAFVLTRDTMPAERTTTSPAISNPSEPGRAPSTTPATTFPTSPMTAASSTAAPSATPSETTSAAPLPKATPPVSSAVAPTTPTPSIKSSSPVGNPPVY